MSKIIECLVNFLHQGLLKFLVIKLTIRYTSFVKICVTVHTFNFSYGQFISDNLNESYEGRASMPVEMNENIPFQLQDNAGGVNKGAYNLFADRYQSTDPGHMQPSAYPSD